MTVWLREPEEFDYIVEPDVFHDFFGHVPLLFDRVYRRPPAGVRQGRPEGACALDAVKMLARLYWYTIEFGLMRHPHGMRAYGAGILSSGGEIAYCVDDPQPQRLAFDLERIMRTEYRIDRYQETYFVIDSLRAADARDGAGLHADLRAPAQPAGAALMQTGRARSGELQIFYRRTGRPGATPLLIVHGLSYFSYDWLPVAQQLGARSRGGGDRHARLRRFGLEPGEGLLGAGMARRHRRGARSPAVEARGARRPLDGRAEHDVRRRQAPGRASPRSRWSITRRRTRPPAPSAPREWWRIRRSTFANMDAALPISAADRARMQAYLRPRRQRQARSLFPRPVQAC